MQDKTKKKIIIAICWLIVLLCVSVTHAGYVFPIFNGSRSEWVEMEAYGTPIIVESGVSFGLTNPNIGETSYSISLRNSDEGISFYKGNMDMEGNIVIHYHNPSVLIEGTHFGPGNPLDGLFLNGVGTVDVWSDLGNLNYDYIGSFTVVPEPSTILIFLTGVVLCRKK